MPHTRCFSCGNGRFASLGENGLAIKYRGEDIILPSDAPVRVCDSCGELSVKADDVEAFGYAILAAYELAKSK